MTRLEKLQLIGPATLMVSVLASETAARALALVPTSETLWYINLTVFGIFKRSSSYLADFIPYGARDYLPVVSAQLLVIVVPIFLVALLGLAFRHRLLLAVASNFSFICAAFLLFGWYADERQSQQASLVIVGALQGPNLYVLTTLIGASLLSFLISHLLYIRDYRNRTA
jgi:hypothetical protein